MKLSTKPCRIVGVRVGEVAFSLLNPASGKISAKFALIGEDGSSFGAFTKEGGWSEEVVKALTGLVDALEGAALEALFDDQGQHEATHEPSELKFPMVPTLGGPKRTDPT